LSEANCFEVLLVLGLVSVVRTFFLGSLIGGAMVTW
jgi:hypothetical protein